LIHNKFQLRNKEQKRNKKIKRPTRRPQNRVCVY
jgi:hypothetical protein